MREQKDTFKNIIISALVLVLLAIATTVLVRVWGPSNDLIVKSDTESILATTEIVQYEAVSINPNPVFSTGKASGNLEIANDEHNRYPEQVEIYTNETHKLIYSGSVEVGQKVETDTLLLDLPNGTYSCTIYFRAINPETGEGVRKESTDITITIKA